jgi:putative glutamine amidotransferase
MDRKKIGISYSEANFQNYWNWFSVQNPEEKFELVLLSFEKNNIEDIYRCDGYVLTGGIDVLPEIYGGQAGYPYQPEVFLPERDEYERIIYQYAQAEQLPVLGICRGMQYINILEGGKVFEDNGEASHLLHKKAGADRLHRVSIQKDSLLYATVKTGTGVVNSAHHQAIDPACFGNNIMASAWSDTPDQLIEAIEFADKTDKAFMLGVQWHPERMGDRLTNPLSEKIKAAFLEAVSGT